MDAHLAAEHAFGWSVGGRKLGLELPSVLARVRLPGRIE